VKAAGFIPLLYPPAKVSIWSWNSQTAARTQRERQHVFGDGESWEVT
jgi:hypothetical protein